MDASQWFKYHNGIVAIFFDAIYMLHDMIAAVTHAAGYNRAKESAKKIDMGLEIEAAIKISFSTVLSSILVGNMKEFTDGAYKSLIGHLNKYSVWSPRGPEVSSVLKARI